MFHQYYSETIDLYYYSITETDYNRKKQTSICDCFSYFDETKQYFCSLCDAISIEFRQYAFPLSADHNVIVNSTADSKI